MSYHQLRKRFEEKYPRNGEQLFAKAYIICDKFDYGFWRSGYTNPEPAPRRTNSAKTYNKKGFYRKLSKSDLLAHISGATYSTLPSATDDNKIYAWFIPLNGSIKRYINIVATTGNGTTGTNLAVMALLDKAERSPTTDTLRGVADVLFV